MQDNATDSTRSFSPGRADGVWRALEEDARCAMIILASQGRALDAESIARAVMRTYEPWPQVALLTERLRACVSEMLRERPARLARRVG